MLSSLVLVAIGYVVAVLFPVPWLSRAILDGWAKLLGQLEKVKAKYSQ